MIYKFATEKENYEDLASGRVLYNAPGATAFPVRLASELFQRARELAVRQTGKTALTVYDPCCGSGYLLTVLGILHGGHVERLVGSDVDGRMLEIARKNLSLLEPAGMDRRLAELQALYEQYGKASHAGALESARRLRQRIARRGSAIPVSLFQADATRPRMPDGPPGGIDLVMADVPYGQVAQWAGGADEPIALLLEHLLPWLHPASLAVIIADKKQRVEHAAYRRAARLKAGKRQAVFLAPMPDYAGKGRGAD